MRSAIVVVATITVVTGLVLACGDSSPSDEGGRDFGCCPDNQTGCTLYRYGKRTSADESCIVGHDGLVPDPSQPGWTRGKDGDGCPYWAPPPNPKMIQCGQYIPPEAGSDAADAAQDGTSDAPSDSSNDAPND